MKAFFEKIIINIIIVAGASCAISLLLYIPVHSILVIFGKIITTSEELKLTTALVVCIELFYFLCILIHKTINSK